MAALRARQIYMAGKSRTYSKAEFPGFPNTWPSQMLAAIAPVTASGVNFAA
jgi:hypothetical protein